MKDKEEGNTIGRGNLRSDAVLTKSQPTPTEQGALEPRLSAERVPRWAETRRPLKLAVLSHWWRDAWEDGASDSMVLKAVR